MPLDVVSEFQPVVNVLGEAQPCVVLGELVEVPIAEALDKILKSVEAIGGSAVATCVVSVPCVAVVRFFFRKT